MKPKSFTSRSSRSLLVCVVLGLVACTPHISRAADHGKPKAPAPRAGEALATFAGGCFWCMEPPFEGLGGVRSVLSGYAGGTEKNPDYEDVANGRTSHTESVQIVFDPQAISFARLVDVFLRSMDPTDLGGQFADRGKQYRPAIFAHDAAQRRVAEHAKVALQKSGRFAKLIVVPVVEYTNFYPAENYHQDYYKKNPGHYKQYRKGSGREGFLKRVWAKAVAQAGSVNYGKPPVAELKRRLSPLQYEVTQQEGTERPFQNAFWDNSRAGIYVDVVSGEPLFSSKDKFKSGTGWPSFVRPLVHDNVVTKVDSSLGVDRTEVRSKHGDSHLGHVFEDGPAPTGLRYCINSAALRFISDKELKEHGYGEFAAIFVP